MMINNNNSINFGAAFSPETIARIKHRAFSECVERTIDSTVKIVADFGDPSSKYNTISLGFSSEGKEAFFLSDGVSPTHKWRLTREFSPEQVMDGITSINNYDVRTGQRSLEIIDRLNLEA